MKKLLSLSLVALMGVFMTSCEEDGDTTSLGPSLVVTELGSGTAGGSMTINEGEFLTFVFESRKGDSDLETFAVSTSGANSVNPIPTSLQGNTFPYDIANADDEIYIDTLIFSNAGANLGNTVYTFSVTDRDGNTEERSFTVTVEAGTTPLSSAQTFTWERVGGAAATGLDQFGLSWTSNSATSAIVAQDAATVMVELSAADWTNITTQEDLATAIDNGTSITEYRGVSAQQNDTYNDVLAVRHNGTDYILNIQQGTVTTGGSGTTIVIEGEYKN